MTSVTFPRTQLLRQLNSSWLLTLFILPLSYTVQAKEIPTSLGVAAAYVPYYYGADKYHFMPVPQAVLFNGLVVMKNNELNFALPLSDTLSAGAVAGWNSGRDASEVPALAGLEDIDASVQYGAFVRWNPGRFLASIKYLKSTEDDQGATATLTLGYDLIKQTEQQLTFAVSGTWRDSDNMQTWYGIDAQQSAASERHYQPYSTSAGVSQITPQLLWQYQLAPQWRINGLLGYSALIDEAADSPLA